MATKNVKSLLWTMEHTNTYPSPLMFPITIGDTITMQAHSIKQSELSNIAQLFLFDDFILAPATRLGTITILTKVINTIFNPIIGHTFILKIRAIRKPVISHTGRICHAVLPIYAKHTTFRTPVNSHLPFHTHTPYDLILLTPKDTFLKTNSDMQATTE
jgi:hypothetical protein